MYKLIAIVVAAIPVILFLKTLVFGKSKVMQQASSSFRKQVGYVAWGMVFLVGCAFLYSVAKLIYPVWK